MMKLYTDAGQLLVEAALARLPWKKGRRMKRKNQHEGCRRLNRTKKISPGFSQPINWLIDANNKRTRDAV
jgi:hypothetical protein